MDVTIENLLTFILSLYNKNLLFKTINFFNEIQIKLPYKTVLKLFRYKMKNNFLLNIQYIYFIANGVFINIPTDIDFCSTKLTGGMISESESD